MKRNLGAILLDWLQTDRAVALLGPRQAGKSYLLKQIIAEKGGVIFNLDDSLLREEIAKDPLGFLKRHYQSDSFLFVDEAAKVPAIFEALKILIDEQENKPSRICLANSGNYLLMKRIKESLAGRVSLLSCYPLSWREFIKEPKIPFLTNILREENPSPPEIKPSSFTDIERTRNERLLWGGFPTPTLAENVESKKRWAGDYLKTYVFPIIIEQFNIRDIEAFEKCARLLFLQSGQILNYHRLAQEVGISQPTVTSYVHQLKAMMLIITLETYYNNPRKRLLKHPKVHNVDPILLHDAFGTNFNLQTARERGNLGAIYESFIVFEIIKTFENYGIPHRLFSWRTADKAEVDLIIESQGKILPLEIKSSENLSPRDTWGLHSFMEDTPQCTSGYIIYPGKKILQLSPRVTALPDWLLLGAYA